MGSFSDIFPLEVPVNLSPDARQKMEERIDGNIAINTASWDEESFSHLQALRQKLEKRHIRAGNLLGVGSFGTIFELKNADGKTVDSAVIRIDPADSIAAIDSPASIKPVFQERQGYYAATIVPMAKSKDYTIADLKPALAVLNAEAKLPHLKDLHSGQFMELPGVSIPVLADLSSIHKTPEASDGGLGGNINSFIEVMKLNADEIKGTKASPKTIAELRAARDALDAKVRSDIAAADINIAPKNWRLSFDQRSANQPQTAR